MTLKGHDKNMYTRKVSELQKSGNFSTIVLAIYYLLGHAWRFLK